MKYFKTYGTFINESLKGGLINEAKKYKIGDTWSRTFDYGGMLAAGLKVDVNTPISELNKLAESFTDVNYHREADHLYKAIETLEGGNKKAASKDMDMFHKACKETLKTNEELSGHAKKMKEDGLSDEEIKKMHPEVTDEDLNEAYSDEQRMELADKGFALADGSYPIKDLKDLKNAIMAYGRAKDQSKTAKFIVKRAKALGAEDLIPDTDDFQKSLKA